MNYHPRVTVLLLGLVLPSWMGCGGQRLLEARIEKNETILLQTHYSVIDRLGPIEAWRKLKSQSFEATEDFDAPKKSETMLLKGKIRIRLLHTNHPFTEVNVNELRLIRVSQDPQHWQIAPDEVERTAKLLMKK